MIKQEDQCLGSNETWTFKGIEGIFYVTKNKNLYRFKASNLFNNHWYESENIELQRINEQTIKAAFDPKVAFVTYEWISKGQDLANLRFKVRIEYLSTEFTEDIELKKIQMNKEQQNRLKLQELLSQVRKVQALLKEKLDSNSKIIVKEQTGYVSSNGSLFQVCLKPGRYSFSLSGCHIDNNLYNGVYEDQYDQMGQYNNPQYDRSLKLRIHKNSQLWKQFNSVKGSYQVQYQYPYVISGLLQIQQEQTISFLVEAAQDNGVVFLMNSNILSVVPVGSDD